MSGIIFPVPDMTRISSGIGNRSSPGGIGSTNHNGIDIAAPRGSPILATTAGRVEVAQGLRGYGNAVYVVDAQGRQHRYAHMDGFNVQAGQTVQAGQQIGTVGSTGNSTGNHLHYELRDAAGRVIDPSSLLGNAISGAGSSAPGLISQAGTAAKDAALAALDRALEAVPVVGGIWSGSKAAGIPNIFEAAMGECGLNPICHFRKWMEETGFFQRVAIALLAFIIIAAALFMLKSGIIEQVTTKAKGIVA